MEAIKKGSVQHWLSPYLVPQVPPQGLGGRSGRTAKRAVARESQKDRSGDCADGGHARPYTRVRENRSNEQPPLHRTAVERLPSLAASAPARALGLAGGEGRPIPAFLAVRCTV
ncbi:hypothetical protein A7K73_03125 [Candidatus Methylacidiphilum fumarolicum]|nr:hypothetical protein A7K73_03125 [Candidatus Methylacidiphilum fumarolicum]TFE77378.1 hypothetical protein A7D33_04575 [Candidatus Methylacidiphilum fumarolicum]